MTENRSKILLLMKTFDLNLVNIFHNNKNKKFNPPLNLEQVLIKLKIKL